MRICSHCGEVVLALEVLRHDTSSRPVAQSMIPKYCPFCGEKLLPWNGDLCYKDGKVLTLGEVFRGESQ